jgi:hypothetical protein
MAGHAGTARRDHSIHVDVTATRSGCALGQIVRRDVRRAGHVVGSLVVLKRARPRCSRPSSSPPISAENRAARRAASARVVATARRGPRRASRRSPCSSRSLQSSEL